jgi:hypothetical protein
MKKTNGVVKALALVGAAAVALWADLAADIESCTGSHSRIVWTRANDAGNPALYGIDTRDGRGVRQIVTMQGNGVSRTDVATDGEHIVFTRGEREIWVVKWDGSGLHKLRSGVHTSVWQDPKTGVHYVLCLDRVADGTKPVKKFPLSDSSKVTTVIDVGVGWSFFNLSADGKCAGIEYETYGNIGVIDMSTSKYTPYHTSEFGCQCLIAPDNSYYVVGLKNLGHANYTLWGHDGKEIKTFAAPAGSNKDCGHPRWVINPVKSRCLVMVSPDEPGDVYVLQHSDDIATLVKKVKLTTTGDCYWPSGWSSSGPTTLQRQQTLRPATQSNWVGQGTSFTMQGRSCAAGAVTAPSCIIRTNAKPGVHLSGLR